MANGSGSRAISWRSKQKRVVAAAALDAHPDVDAAPPESSETAPDRADEGDRRISGDDHVEAGAASHPPSIVDQHLQRVTIEAKGPSQARAAHRGGAQPGSGADRREIGLAGEVVDRGQVADEVIGVDAEGLRDERADEPRVSGWAWSGDELRSPTGKTAS
jgi:hypothetical protein